MLKYSADNLAVMSTILTCATRTQIWDKPGTAGAGTQEEIQMMRVADCLFIACNYAGHALVQNFLTAFGVGNEATFIESLKWSHLIAKLPHLEAQKLYCEARKKSTYSDQEEITVSKFRFPAGVPHDAGVPDLAILYNCVGKPVTGHAAPNTPADWKVGPFQQLLGWYSNKKGYKDTYGAHPIVDVQSRKLNAVPDLTKSITLITDSSAVHAELKLLAFLTKMTIDGKVSGKDVYLGGLKAACKECSKWIGSYVNWLYYRKDINLHLPSDDTRASAGPVNWNKPTVDQAVKDDSGIKSVISTLFN